MKHALRVLADARPAELDPDLPVPPDVRHRELAGVWRSARGGARRAGRWRWRIGLGATVVGLGAVAVAVVVAPGQGHGPRPGGVRPTVALSARQVLLSAADSAAEPRGTTGRYFHSVLTRRLYQPVVSGAGRYVVVDLVREEGWFGSDDCVDQIQDLGTRPAGPQDDAVWRKAGSPRRFLFRGGLWQSAAPGPAHRRQVRLEDDSFAGPIRNLAELASLPTDPQALKTLLLERRPASSAQEPPAEYLFSAGVSMSLGTPLKPQVRAALLRMMAGLPGITSLGRTTDLQGRTGTAVAMTIRTGAGETSRVRLIIDPATGMPLGQDVTITSTANDGPGRLRPGETSAATTLDSTGWTNTHP